jgi:hypothetical protein
VSDWELATRLSYFLTSSAPDDELRTLAAVGRLSGDKVLAAQARRLLRTEKIRRLATEFGCQYLHVRDVAALDEKSERHFPEFTDLRGLVSLSAPPICCPNHRREDCGGRSLHSTEHSRCGRSRTGERSVPPTKIEDYQSE